MSPLTIGLLVLLAVAVVYVAMNYNRLRASIEMFTAEEENKNKMAPMPAEMQAMMPPTAQMPREMFENTKKPAAAPAPTVAGFENHMGAKKEQFANPSEPSEVPFAAGNAPSNCYPKNQLNPLELLPSDPNSKWAQVNPQGAGDIAGKNYLNAGALIGVNTVGQSLRNASWDLRSEPANPQVAVSPWFNSTIEPDVNRRTMEIA
jgi:hypothetical protein